MSSSLELVERRVRVAALARAQAEAQQTAERQKLAPAAWRGPLLRQAGHGQDAVERLKEQLQEQSHLFSATRGYVHETSLMIGTSWWAPGPTAPLTPMSDRRTAETELARVGASVWTALLVAVDLAEATRSHEAFGPITDQAEYDRARRTVVDRAAAALADVEVIDERLLIAIAWRLGLALDPVENLAQRLVDHEMHPAAPARREPERVGEIADVVGWR